jgi:hypothetical protein
MREQRRVVTGGSGDEPMTVRPRVVILEAELEPGVEVVELSEGIRIGASFFYRGTVWTVTGERPGSHVLYAAPSLT